MNLTGVIRADDLKLVAVLGGRGAPDLGEAVAKCCWEFFLAEVAARIHGGEDAEVRVGY